MGESRVPKKRLLTVIAVSFLAGMLWLVAIRFITFQQPEVHYHANFAVFIDGERDPFDRFTFYEEIEACGGNAVDSPKIRVHMHDEISHVIHVHDNGATWGHFFANLNYVLGDTVFRTDVDAYVEDDDTQIRFMLNGEEVDTATNRTIGDLDVLLVSVGQPTDADLQAQYDQIQRDAAKYNEEDDPSACSGNKELTFGERLKKAIGVFDEL